MDGYKLNEITYTNGEVYKKGYTKLIKTNQSTKISFTPDGIRSEYFENDTYSKLFPYIGIRYYPDGEILVKKYFETKNFCEAVGIEGGVDISHLDISPDIKFIAFYTEHVGRNSCEVCFNGEDKDTLGKIAEYYNIKHPLPDDVEMDIDDDSWGEAELAASLRFSGYNWDEANPLFIGTFKFCTIRFEDGNPTLIKAYKKVK